MTICELADECLQAKLSVLSAYYITEITHIICEVRRPLLCCLIYTFSIAVYFSNPFSAADKLLTQIKFNLSGSKHASSTKVQNCLLSHEKWNLLKLIVCLNSL